MSQISGVNFPRSPRYPHQMDLHFRGWLTTSNTASKVPLIFLWSQCSHLFFLFQNSQLCFIYAASLRKFHDSLSHVTIVCSFPLTLAFRQWRISTIGSGRCNCNPTKKNAESYSFSHSPHVTPSLNIKHHISILHSCDGYVWLLTWLHLELSNTQMIRHTCNVWYFFLIKSFDVARPTSHLDLWGGKIHLYSEPNLLLAAYRKKKTCSFFACLFSARPFLHWHWEPTSLGCQSLMKPSWDIQPC